MAGVGKNNLKIEYLEISSSDLAGITGGRLSGEPDLTVTDLLTDSRQLSITEGMAFFAIKGNNHDGHSFIESLYDKGIRIFVVENLPLSLKRFKGAAFIETVNSVEALQKVAISRRESFRNPVVAVTGSAGKTVVKEWLADVAGLAMPVIRSPRSYNSQIGVPLSVWKLDDRFRLGIFEAGISKPGEMKKLQKIINPDIGVITNIGEAHGENFKSPGEKAAEKLYLFKNASTIIYCRDQKEIHKLIEGDASSGSKDIYDWSFSDIKARVYVERSEKVRGRTLLQIHYQGSVMQYEIPFSDRASVENALSVLTVCLALGIENQLIVKGLAELNPVAMRMELKSGINNCQLIEDYYNSDPGSLGMALEYLKSQNNRKSALILSDFLQSGRDEKELYSGVAELVKRTGVDRFVGIGHSLMRHSNLFGTGAEFYYTTDEFINRFNPSSFRNEVILLKGARVYEFEKIARLLEQQVHTTVLEINLDAISHNLNEIRKCINPGTRIMAMVKAFAYGAGPAEIASLLEFHRVSYLTVAYADEGVELRKAGVTLPVMVMNHDPSSADQLISYNLEPEIFSFSSLKNFTDCASRHGLVNYPVHIKIDTGMHRLGFLPGDIDELISLLPSYDSIRIVSVLSHLAAADDPSLDHFTHRQVDTFVKASEKIGKATAYPFLRHILNTSGIIRFPQYQFDMVRPGIGIYGVGHYQGISLRPAGRFKTRISQVKTIPAGEPVGYNCMDVADHERQIAILPVGYADGLDRKLGNRNGSVFIRSALASLTGNICMDMCMVDITGIGAVEGDEAEIFGENLPIEEMAGKINTIPYEILTSIPSRVKRIFFRE